jgi:hypothetical protein
MSQFDRRHRINNLIQDRRVVPFNGPRASTLRPERGPIHYMEELKERRRRLVAQRQVLRC